MDLDMYQHPTTKKSFEALKSFGNIMIPATSGELASGLHGEGRMAEPEAILQFLSDYLSVGLPLKNKKVLITAGPTYEAIDPVRFIGNHSSGLMGFELAKAASDLGAKVILVSGPSKYEAANESIHLIRVVTADEMYERAHEHFVDSDIVICAAAVADYKPKVKSVQKIKKSDAELQIDLVKNRDILYSFGQEKKSQFLVGFALETENELENAKSKLKRKNLDAIVLNSMNDKGAGFGGATNKISFIDTNLEIQTFELKTKAAVAKDILNEIIKRRHA
jgi:phosphopantothenoylcysteine decarboxylase/phosphopantothenate--cysteine ligase